LHEGEPGRSAHRPEQRLPGTGRLRRDHRRITTRGQPRPAARADQGAGARPSGVRLVSRPAEVWVVCAQRIRPGTRAHSGMDLRDSAHSRSNPVPETDSQVVPVAVSRGVRGTIYELRFTIYESRFTI